MYETLSPEDYYKLTGTLRPHHIEALLDQCVDISKLSEEISDLVAEVESRLPEFGTLSDLYDLVDEFDPDNDDLVEFLNKLRDEIDSVGDDLDSDSSSASRFLQKIAELVKYGE